MAAIVPSSPCLEFPDVDMSGLDCISFDDEPRGGASSSSAHLLVSSSSPSGIDLDMLLAPSLVGGAGVDDDALMSALLEPLDQASSSSSAASHSSSSLEDDSRFRRPTKGGLQCDQEPGRNARMAKENRERKKRYVTDLEARLKDLATKNAELRAEQEKADAKLRKAEAEVAYLRSIIANESTLTQFVTVLGSAVPGITFAAAGKRAASEDEAPATRAAKRVRTHGPTLSTTATGGAAAAAATPFGSEATIPFIPLQINLHFAAAAHK